MISFIEACKIAFKKKKEYAEHGIKAKLVRALDCGSFFTFQVGCFDNTGKQYYPMGGKHEYDISVSDGRILDFPPYFPGTEYGNIIDHANELEIPEEYRE